MIHQVAQAHDAQADAPGAERRLLELRHRRDVVIGVHDIIQEMRRKHAAFFQLAPIHAAYPA